MEAKRIKATTSTISVIETFVLPEQYGDQFLLSEYEKIFQNLPGLTIVSVDWTVGRLTARLRAQYPKIRIPDASQLSAAILSGAKAFITNDEQLTQVKEIQVVLLKDYV
jgi:predicted nucleic acid-binding protein